MTNVTHAIHNRIYSWITSADVLQFILLFYKFIAVVMVTWLFFAPERTAEIISRNNGVVAKWFFWINIVMFLDILLIRIDWSWIPTISFEEDSTNRSTGAIMLSDVVNFIYDHRGFPVSKVREAFGFSVPQVKSIWDSLESAGLLERGANNARVLSAHLNRNKLDDIISEFDIPVEELSSSFIPTSNGYQSFVSAVA